MAQLSKGIKLGYGAYTGTDSLTAPTTYTYIPDITSIPALGSTPSTHQTTTLTDEMHTYIMGLQDTGGALEFSCFFTKEVIDAVDTAIETQEAGKIRIAVEFPAPLSKRMWFDGTFSPVYNTDVDVDSPVSGTVAVIANTIITTENLAG